MPFFAALIALFLSFVPPAHAQSRETVKDIPAPLVPLADKGAQLRYLGTEHGMEGWIAMFQGQEQFYYITPDKKGFVTGLMFGEDGKPITINQVRDLQKQGGAVLDMLAEGGEGTAATAEAEQTPASVMDVAKTKTPGERMFADIEGSNWIPLGNLNAPVIYSFIDPNCPHCHEFITDLRKNYIDKGLVQVRLIPVGFQQGSLAQAAFLIAAPNAPDLFLKHLDGDAGALPAKNDVSTQAVQKNMALMQSWKFNVTPLTTYRSRTGEVKIVRGRAKDVQALIADLPNASTPAQQAP